MHGKDYEAYLDRIFEDINKDGEEYHFPSGPVSDIASNIASLPLENGDGEGSFDNRKRLDEVDNAEIFANPAEYARIILDNKAVLDEVLGNRDRREALY